MGDWDWITSHYDLRLMMDTVDELGIINVSGSISSRFLSTVEKITELCFGPVSVTGGIRTMRNARFLFETGVEKLGLATDLTTRTYLVEEISSVYGKQATIAHLDIHASSSDRPCIVMDSGSQSVLLGDLDYLPDLLDKFGELSLHSVSQEGTGRGLELGLTDLFPKFKNPITISGGATLISHFSAGFSHNRISAIATSNLINYVGVGLSTVRTRLIQDGLPISRHASMP